MEDMVNQELDYLSNLNMVVGSSWAMMHEVIKIKVHFKQNIFRFIYKREFVDKTFIGQR